MAKKSSFPLRLTEGGAMRSTMWFVLVAIIILVCYVRFSMKRGPNLQAARSLNGTHIVLIGASIGQSWHLAEWPSRVRTSDFTAESVAAWQFDKTEAVEEVLMRPAR